MSTSSTRIVPAIIPTSVAHALDAFLPLRGVVPGAQVDIVDGVFAPFTSWPYNTTPRESFKELAALSAETDLELDLMIQNPEDVLDECFLANPKRIIVHATSTTHLGRCIDMIRDADVAVGLGLHNDVPLATVTEYIDQIDFIQCMGIADIGQQGAPFDERTILRIKELREYFPGLVVAVDGSVNGTTLPKLFEAGATQFAVGSALVGAPDPKAAYEEFASTLNTPRGS